MQTPRSDEEVKWLSKIYGVPELAIRFNDDIRMGGFDFVTLLTEGADVNAPTLNGYTPLHTAAGVGNTNIAKRLIELKADVNAKNVLGQTALHSAAGKMNPKMAALLLESGADVNVADIYGVTPLHMAASPDGTLETVDLLLSRGADPGAKTNERGITPLHMAGIFRNREKAAHMIVKKPEAATITDHDGNLPTVFEGDPRMDNMKGQVQLLARTAAPAAAAERRMPAVAAYLRKRRLPTAPPPPPELPPVEIAKAAVAREKAKDVAEAAARAEAAGKKYVVGDDDLLRMTPTRAGRRQRGRGRGRGRKTVKVNARNARKRKTMRRR